MTRYEPHKQEKKILKNQQKVNFGILPEMPILCRTW